jgi:hypothetical protein
MSEAPAPLEIRRFQTFLREQDQFQLLELFSQRIWSKNLTVDDVINALIAPQPVTQPFLKDNVRNLEALYRGFQEGLTFRQVVLPFPAAAVLASSKTHYHMMAQDDVIAVPAIGAAAVSHKKDDEEDEDDDEIVAPGDVVVADDDDIDEERESVVSVEYGGYYSYAR